MAETSYSKAANDSQFFRNEPANYTTGIYNFNFFNESLAFRTCTFKC